MIKEYPFETYDSRGLRFTFAPDYLHDDGVVYGFTVTILYEDMEAFGEQLGIDPRDDDWMTEESFYEEMHDAIMDVIPFLTFRFHDAIADEAGEVWYYTTHNLDYHASKTGVTVKDEVIA